MGAVVLAASPFLNLQEEEKMRTAAGIRNRKTAGRSINLSKGEVPVANKEHKGSVREFKEGVYQGRVLLGYDSVTGREIRPVVYGESEREAWKKLEVIIDRYEKGQSLKESRVKFGDWLKRWLENHVKIRSRLTTWENYKWAVDNHIVPAIGKITLKDLRASHLQVMYREKLESGREDKEGGLSARSVQLIHRVCHAALEQAVKEDVIAKNVAKSVSLPPKVRKEIQPMTPEQIKQFLGANKESPLFAAFFILLSTGVRRGELLGIQWSDIDFANQTVYIQRSWVKSKTKKAQFAEPKTAKSRRVIPLSSAAIEVLKLHKERQGMTRKQREEKGQSYSDRGLVFCRDDGVPYYPQTLNFYLEKALETAGLPRFRVHDIRHTFASLMVGQGISVKVVQELMGHATVQMTLDTYSHVLPGAKTTAVNQVQGFFSVDTTPSPIPNCSPEK